MLRNTPPIVKNLLIINVLMFFATYVFHSNFGINLNHLLALHHWTSEHFNPFQFISYMFMHGGPSHIFFNMFALWMFGRVLEQFWGSKRFLTFYLVTGVGAAVVHLIVTSISLAGMENEIYQFQNDPSFQAFRDIIQSHGNVLRTRENYGTYQQVIAFAQSWQLNPENSGFYDKAIQYSDIIMQANRNIPTVGASGSVFGLLLAFGMLFPNTQLLLLFPPIPIKAKYFVFFYGLLELYLGVSNNEGDNVAHFAHLGGMLFGYLLIRYWKKNSNTFY